VHFTILLTFFQVHIRYREIHRQTHRKTNKKLWRLYRDFK